MALGRLRGEEERVDFRIKINNLWTLLYFILPNQDN